MSGSRGVTNWRAQQMRYNGRYPVNEMWDVRQSLIQEFGRNVSTNKYLASMDRKCYEYVQNCRENRFKKYNWRNQEKGNTSNNFVNQEDELQQNYDENQLQGETSSCNDDIPSDRFYLDFDGDKREFGLTNAELLVKEEPENSDNEKNNVSYVVANTFSNSDVDVRNASKGFRSESEMVETNTLSQEDENNVDTSEQSRTTNIHCNDVVDGCSQDNSELPVEENEEGIGSQKAEISEKRKSKKLDSPEKRKSKKLDSPEKQRSKELDSPEKRKSKEVNSPEKQRSNELGSPGKGKSKELGSLENSKTAEKIKNYKQFVRTVSKLVNKKRKGDSCDKQKEEVDFNGEVSENSKNSISNSENKNTQKEGSDKSNGKSKLKTSKMTDKKDSKIIRSTRSSSRFAKEDAVEKNTIKKKDSKLAKSLDSKQNSSNMKTRNKYKSRLRSNSENLPSGDEGEVTSTSKQLVKKKVKVKKRKSVSSPDDDIPLAKYPKGHSNDIETKSSSDLEELDNEKELDKTIDYSHSDENKDTGSYPENTPFDDSDFNKHEIMKEENNEVKLLKNSYSDGIVNQNDSTSDIDKMPSPSKNEGCEILKDSEDMLDSSLIIIDESNSCKKPESEFQINRDLDCYNNNKDKISESDKVGSTSNHEEKLWEYLKCDFCDFLVSKKKSQNYQLMEEHLESTKHNAASIVKVSITDGELKPLFVKKEHAILFSLEKASILPYCPICCTVMPSIWTVQLHARFKHPNHVQKDVYSLGKVESVLNVPIPKKIDMCKQCGQRKIHIQKHWKSHNHYPYMQPTDDQIALYSCNICHRHFESFFSALSHAVVHSQEGQRGQNIGVRVTYLSKSNQTLTLLPREKTLTSGRAIEMLNQARAANKTGQWTRSQRKEFETMAIEWKRRFKQN